MKKIDFKNVFEELLTADNEGKDVLLLSKYSWVYLDVFYNFFADVKDMSKESFLEIDNGNLGYEDYINEWHKKGILD